MSIFFGAQSAYDKEWLETVQRVLARRGVVTSLHHSGMLLVGRSGLILFEIHLDGGLVTFPRRSASPGLRALVDEAILVANAREEARENERAMYFLTGHHS
jgi:hypothetical protein